MCPGHVTDSLLKQVARTKALGRKRCPCSSLGRLASGFSAVDSHLPPGLAPQQFL
ncbi:hypothetical protein ACRRTK_022800 [Alexandromys fortis]